MIQELARHGEDALPLKPSSFVRWLERDQTAVLSAARLSTRVENLPTTGLSNTQTAYSLEYAENKGKQSLFLKKMTICEVQYTTYTTIIKSPFKDI
jgi:hypothetical protein